jgi:hypothetical protein
MGKRCNIFLIQLATTTTLHVYLLVVRRLLLFCLSLIRSYYVAGLTVDATIFLVSELLLLLCLPVGRSSSRRALLFVIA